MRARPPPICSTRKFAERRLVSSSSRACTTSVGQRISFARLHQDRAQAVDLPDALERHPPVVEILAALELRLDDRAQLLVLDAERILLLDLHRAADAGHRVEQRTQAAIPGRGPAVDVHGRREHARGCPSRGCSRCASTAASSAPMHMPITCSRGCWSRTSRYLATTASIQSSAVTPARSSGFVPWPGSVSECVTKPGVLQPLVHRAQVVLRAAEPVDQEHAVGRRPRAAAAAHRRRFTASLLGLPPSCAHVPVAAVVRNAHDADDAMQLAVVVADRARLVARGAATRRRRHAMR